MSVSEGRQDVVRTVKLTVRVSEELHDAVTARAKAEGKTMNALVIEALEQPVPKPPAQWESWMPSRMTLTEQHSRYRMALEAILSVNRYEHANMVAIAKQALR